MTKSVFTATATGEQGCPLSILLLQLDYKVQILVRDSSSSAAQALRVLGAEVHTGNLESFEAVANAIAGAGTVYLALPPNLKMEFFARTGDHETFPDWSKEDPSAQYWFQKDDIEKTVRTLGFSYWKILRPAFFMQNFCYPNCDHMFPGLSETNTLRIAFLQSTRLDLISAGDVARFATKAIQSPNRFSKKTLTLAADKLSAAEIADQLGTVSGKEIIVEYLPNQVARTLRKQGNGVVGAQIWQRDVGYYADIDALSEYGVSLTPVTEAQRAAWEDGVGYATARAFVRAGASAVALADLHGISDDLVTKLKLTATQAGHSEPTVLSCTVDISKEESVQAMYKIVSERFDGRLDILINNAAHMKPYKPLLDSDPDVHWRTWEVNIHGILNIARAFLPMQLLARVNNNGLCTMINVSSSGALSARPGSASYRSSKLAILRLTESLQLEYGDQGFPTYCVNPGAIKTKVTETAPKEVRNRFPDRPEIAGDTIAWLAAERKEWLGGRYVSFPWDMEELMKKKDEIIEKDLLKMRMAF